MCIIIVIITALDMQRVNAFGEIVVGGIFEVIQLKIQSHLHRAFDSSRKKRRRQNKISLCVSQGSFCLA